MCESQFNGITVTGRSSVLHSQSQPHSHSHCSRQVPNSPRSPIADPNSTNPDAALTKVIKTREASPLDALNFQSETFYEFYQRCFYRKSLRRYKRRLTRKSPQPTLVSLIYNSEQGEPGKPVVACALIPITTFNDGLLLDTSNLLLSSDAASPPPRNPDSDFNQKRAGRKSPSSSTTTQITTVVGGSPSLLILKGRPAATNHQPPFLHVQNLIFNQSELVTGRSPTLQRN